MMMMMMMKMWYYVQIMLYITVPFSVMDGHCALLLFGFSEVMRL